MDDVDDIFDANPHVEDCFGGNSPGSVPIHPHDKAVHPYERVVSAEPQFHESQSSRWIRWLCWRKTGKIARRSLNKMYLSTAIFMFTLHASKTPVGAVHRGFAFLLQVPAQGRRHDEKKRMNDTSSSI
jgi:hypothetical protein